MVFKFSWSFDLYLDFDFIEKFIDLRVIGMCLFCGLEIFVLWWIVFEVEIDMESVWVEGVGVIDGIWVEKKCRE